MNFSTSSFKKSPARSKTAGIALLLLLGFGAAEFGARKYARRRQNSLSDPKDFTSIGARAQNLMRQNGSKIVFVGNSATEEGVDMEQFGREIAAQNGTKNGAVPLHLTFCTAVDSNVKDWHWMLERNYFRPRRRADLFVVTWFSATLGDGPVVNRGRLAQFFTTPRDWPAVFQTDVTTLDERADFVFSYASILFAMREITQEKLLRLSAPGYQNYAQQLNDTTRKQVEARELAAARAEESSRHQWQALRRLLQKARQNQAKLCFVAYPRRDARYAYSIDSQMVISIRQAGMTFLDLRHTASLSPGDYSDSIHLNAAGKAKWTRHLARTLQPMISDLGR